MLNDCDAAVNGRDELKSRVLELEAKLHDLEMVRAQLQAEHIEISAENVRINEANLRLVEDCGAAVKERQELQERMASLNQDMDDLSSALTKQRLATQSNLDLLMAALEKVEEYHEASEGYKNKLDKLNLKFMSAREDLAWNRDRLFWYRDAFPSAARLSSEYTVLSLRLSNAMSRLLNCSPR